MDFEPPSQVLMPMSEDFFDEEKCRNVLVRYCAHIPRNYKYVDGVRLVFLVLRDHLGDENLGLAGGVLYELIEVDCHYSDDPGAAFQRWRHDHMNRHDDLELPHVPHLTTVSTPISPTPSLAQWRAEHPERYHTRLSDHSVELRRHTITSGSLQQGGSWIIDHTTYVSSRLCGTRPLYPPNARHFGEVQWTPGPRHRGKMVQERSFDFDQGVDQLTAASSTPTSPLTPRSVSRIEGLRGSTPSRRHRSLSEAFIKVRERFITGGKASPSHISTTTLDQSGVCESQQASTSSHHDFLNYDVPNAAFARKFGLLKDRHDLPPSIRELPVADEKAVINANGFSVKNLKPTFHFQGPFTPQLWFDGGLDFLQARK